MGASSKPEHLWRRESRKSKAQICAMARSLRTVNERLAQICNAAIAALTVSQKEKPGQARL